ncbi:MAG: SAM-dependent methyltransferase [Enterococcus sp.]|uniref:SAM-dependent methyltransferase n=1 Tax=Enterococcus sp. TaxID=35783 RepID=UPI0039945E2C
MTKFYGVGTGPGASDLLTIRGKEVLQMVDCLHTPEPKRLVKVSLYKLLLLT